MDVEFLKYQYEDGYYGVITKHGFRVGVRHLQMLYMFASAVVMGMIRGTTGIGLLAISDESRRGDNYIQIHDWDRRIQGAILGAFFFGYSVMLIPTEIFIKKFNGKIIVSSILLANGGLCVAMPTIINKGGWVAACNAQLLLGITHGVFASVNQALIDSWLPPIEKKIFSSLVFNGILLGVIIIFPISSVLVQSPLGWELIYYSLAMLTLGTAVTFGTLTASSPADHQAIGNNEKEYISDSLACYRKKAIQKPWHEILTSTEFWAIACAHAASNAIFVFCLTDVPFYLKSLGMPLKDTVFYSMMPFLAMWVIYFITNPIIDWFYSNRYIGDVLNLTYFRKFINALGAFGIVIIITILPNLNEKSVNYAIILITAMLGLLGLQFSGFLRNHREMSENFSGTLMVLTSTVSSVVGTAVPFVSGLLLTDGAQNKREWRVFMLGLASMYIFCNMVYTAFGSNERQHWDYVNGGMKKRFNGMTSGSNKVRVQVVSHLKLIQNHENDSEM